MANLTALITRAAALCGRSRSVLQTKAAELAKLTGTFPPKGGVATAKTAAAVCALTIGPVTGIIPFFHTLMNVPLAPDGEGGNLDFRCKTSGDALINLFRQTPEFIAKARPRILLMSDPLELVLELTGSDGVRVFGLFRDPDCEKTRLAVRGAKIIEHELISALVDAIQKETPRKTARRIAFRMHREVGSMKSREA